MGSEPKPEAEQDLRGMWLTLAMTATFMIVVAYNTTAVITILPNLRAEFDLRPAALQWVMAIYTVSGASLVPIMGRLGDIHGLIKIFVLGMVIFTVGAVVVVTAGDSVFLLTGRLLQGVGAAATFGTSLGVLSASAPESQRAFVVGLWGAMVALGFSLGPIIGGLFAEYWTWRGIFYCDMLLFLVALGLAWRIFKAGYMPEVSRTEQKVDYLGAVLLILVLGPFAFGLERSESHGWTAPSTFIPMIVTVVAAAIFYRVEHRTREPLLHLGYFRHPRFFMSAIGMFIACFVLICFFFRFNIFVQSPDTFDMSPVVAGAAVLPLSIVMFLFSVFAVRVLQPYSFRWPVAIGMTCLTVACALLATTSNTATYGDIWWKILILGFGFGLTIPLLPRVGLRILPEEDSGQGSGLINTCFYFGATIGVVGGGVAAAFAMRSGIAQVAASLPSTLPNRDAIVSTLTHGSRADIEHALAALNSSATGALRDALIAVQDDAFNSALVLAAIVAAVGAVLAIWLMRGPIPEPNSAAHLR